MERMFTGFEVQLPLAERITILTEGAKYDVSCSSSGADTKAKKGTLGDCATAGICHSFAADGRCISLLKILMSNKCEYDCKYCVSRRSNDVKRTSLTAREIAELTIGFYRRNYIEGLFLSSAVEKSPNHTMHGLIDTLRILRVEFGFGGYIHVKAIPGADSDLIDEAARLADRMSMNIELPSEESLKLLAPQKKREILTPAMRQLANYKGDVGRIPAGQTTQMIVGASRDTDGQIIRLSEALYDKFYLKRVYYSAYVPVGDHSNLPVTPPDLRREHRLYQADWLLRFYGFAANELIPVGTNLSRDVDPKCDWALRNIRLFPLEVNTASYEMLLRVPGIGVKNAWRIKEERKRAVITFEVLKKMRVVLKRAQHFITANGKFIGVDNNPDYVRAVLSDNTLALPEASIKYAVGEQLNFFDMESRLLGQI